jgi:hypothetical protein
MSLRLLLTYVDESYTTEWFAIAALLVDGPAAIALTTELDRIASMAAGAYGLGADIELHGHEIFHGRGAWNGVPVRARIGIFDDVIEAISVQDIRIIARAMDVVGQNTRYQKPDPPYQIVLRHLLERIDECAVRGNDYALVIADEVSDPARHRGDLLNYRRIGTIGYRRRRLSRIVDTLHYAPSHASRLVQAADMVAFLYRRTFAHQETDTRARKIKVAMWKRLEPRVHHELCWFPAGTDRRRLWAQDFR